MGAPDFAGSTVSFMQFENTMLGETPPWIQHREVSSYNMEPNPQGDLDGGLISALRRIAMGGAIDHLALRTMLDTVVAGRRLSDSQIDGLPKVRFAAAEEQSCAICLEAYRDDELLTALPCSHVYHVECLTRWLQRSSHCPLCRGAPIPDTTESDCCEELR